MSDPLLAIVFIDYDNLRLAKKELSVLDVATRVLVQLQWDQSQARGCCEIRVYGGWYEGNQITRMAQELAVNLKRDFPAVIRVPIGDGKYLPLKTSAELAFSLLQEPAYHLFNTYRKKEKPRNVRIEKPSQVGCEDADCLLPQMKNLLNKGSCPKMGCSVTSCELVYRREQKIVDTMLACDLIHAVDRVSGQVILVSADDDFLPPLRTVLLRGGRAVRCHPLPSTERAAFPQGRTKLLELD